MRRLPWHPVYVRESCQNNWGDLAAKGTRLHLPHKYFNLTYNVVMSLFSLGVTVAVIDVLRRLPIMSNDCLLYAR
jgi:hypothetical protein